MSNTIGHSRRIVGSNAYALLTQEAARFLAETSGSEVVVVAASRGATDDLARQTSDVAAFGIHRTTLTGLAANLATISITQAKLAPMSNLSREAMAAHVIHRLKRDSIPYYRPVSDMPGLARAIARTAQELRLQKTDVPSLATTGEPGADLARILKLYHEELIKSSLADFSVLLAHATETARSGRHRLLDLPVLLLDVNLESIREREFLRAVIERSPKVLAACLSGDRISKNALEEICARESEDLDETAPRGSLNHARAHLFSSSAPDNPGEDDSIDLFSAAGEGLECVEIARRILALAQGGVAFDRMAILLRGPERYQALLEEALRRAGIPGWFSRGVARPDPAGRAFLSLLACASERCSASRFAEYLSLGQVPSGERAQEIVPMVPDDEILAAYQDGNAAPPPQETRVEDAPTDESAVIEGSLQSPAAWEKLLVDAAVIGGKDRWERRLRGLEEELRARLRELDDADESERAQLERQIQLLGNLERFALPLIERLAALPPSARWDAWLGHLSELAHACLRRPESVLSVLGELQSMEDVGPIGLDEVIGVLSDRLRFLRRDPPLRRYGHVFVGTIDEARGRSFEAVFLPGLAEGLFPRKVFEDAILLDDYRRNLPGLFVQNDRVLKERKLLHIALAAAQSRLIFSYPRMDVAQARPRVPSFYALEIFRAARGRLPDLQTFEKSAAQAAPSRLDWPAPRDRMQAIDDAEYDLATLGRTLSLQREEARATGNYLIDANPALVRSLRTRARRWRSKWFGADGLVEPDSETLAAAGNYVVSKRAYSPSALQQFAACPYKFLLYGIHQLRPREEIVALEQMDPLTRGSLFHQVQFEYFKELNAKGSADVDRILDRVALEYEDKLAPAIPRVWKSEVEDIRADLRGWLRQRASEDPDWKPVHFEFSFGLKIEGSRDAASTTQVVQLPNGMLVRGVIDLVEKRAGVLRVTDHKTGKAPASMPQAVAGGSLLQPLIYALAVENLLNAPVHSGRLSYCTQRGGYQQIDIAVDQRGRERIQRVLAIIDSHIQRGFLAAAPAKGACGYCDYRPVCGPYEESRVSRKSRELLDDLNELRGLP